MTRRSIPLLFAPSLDRRALHQAYVCRNSRHVRDKSRRLAIQTLESRRVLASFIVTTSADVVDSADGVLSLREAIAAANSSADSDTITFDGATFGSATAIDLALGELVISNPLEIIGPGRDLLTIDAQQLSRVIIIQGFTGDVKIQGLIVTGGRTVNDNVESEGVIETQQSGGGIRFAADGILTIQNSTITGNETGGVSATGGGLFADRGTLVLNNSTIFANRTRGRSAFGAGVFAENTTLRIERSQVLDNFTSGPFSDGGGIFARLGSVEIVDSLISGNRTTSGGAYGGGLYVNGVGTVIERSTISGNRADGFGSVGGGIAMHSDVQLINSTIEGNSADGSAGSGGGIAIIKGELTSIQSTITENTATLGSGGGIIVMNNPDTRLNLFNSIVAGNVDSGVAPDFLAPADAARLLVRGSLIGDHTGTTLAESQTANSFGNIVGAPLPGGGGLIDPLLAPLGNNGGPTPTRHPLTGSPAIDSGDDSLAVDHEANVLTSDQRGFLFQRKLGSKVDIGAIEVQPIPAVVISWDPPAAITVGTALTEVQLNATAPVAGAFTYTPPLGTVLAAGENQVLFVEFVPEDKFNYSNGSTTVTIDVVNPLEFGDAPASYKTTLNDDGARHGAGTLRLGSAANLEADGQPSGDASADSGDDGVRQIAPLLAHSTSATTTSFLVNASAVSKLDGWIDFNRNGVFDHPSEHLGGGTSIDLAIRDNVVSVVVPAGAVAGETFARFRVSSSGGLLPTGLASNGEVEDYAITIINGDSAREIAITLPSGAVTLGTDATDLLVRSGAKDLFQAPSSSITRYNIVGASSSDVLSIDYTSGNPIPTGGMAYDGGDRVNTVRILGDKSRFDASSDGNIELKKIDAIDLGASDAVTFVVDSAAMALIDPDGGGLVVTGGPLDLIRFDDPQSWRIGEPQVVAGFFFTRLEAGSKFIQTDLPIAWHNFIQPNDINNDRSVTAGDALRVINELTLRRFSDPVDGLLDNPADFDPFPGVYFDQNGDGRVSALDALRVINQLARQQGSGEGELGLALALKNDSETVDPIISQSDRLVASLNRTKQAASFDRWVTEQPTQMVATEYSTDSSSESLAAVDQVFAESTSFRCLVDATL